MQKTFTKIENDILEAIIQGKFSEVESRILLFFKRMTNGWQHNKALRLSVTLLVEQLKAGSTNVKKALASLIKKGWIEFKQVNGRDRIYRLAGSNTWEIGHWAALTGTECDPIELVPNATQNQDRIEPGLNQTGTESNPVTGTESIPVATDAGQAGQGFAAAPKESIKEKKIKDKERERKQAAAAAGHPSFFSKSKNQKPKTTQDPEKVNQTYAAARNLPQKKTEMSMDDLLIMDIENMIKHNQLTNQNALIQYVDGWAISQESKAAIKEKFIGRFAA